MRAVRFWLTRIHRWTGLALALFLVIVGFTGALLPFQGDIQHWLAPMPERVVQPPGAGAKPLDWLTLHAIAERRSGGVIDDIPLHREPGEALTFGVAARPGRPPLGYGSIVLDPYTGREIARDGPGGPGGFVAQIMPFLYRLHTSLALGEWGAWLLGVAALAWTIDCFVGFYLTLPPKPLGWWRIWRHAWKVRLPPRSAFRFNFDLHRAAGLWLWPALFVFAWSSVSFNLNSVYAPVMRLLSDYSLSEPRLPDDGRGPLLDWRRALQAARQNVAAAGRARGFTVERERALSVDRESGTYSYVVRTSRDLSDDYANSWFTIDGRTGRVIGVDLPTGEHAGNTIGYWLGILHTAGIFGLPYRIFVTLTGVVIMVLSITGILIWNRKRSARLRAARRPSVRSLLSFSKWS